MTTHPLSVPGDSRPASITPVARIVPQAFAAHRIDPDAAKVVLRLARAGFKTYLVGGCVRDLLLDRTPKDFDVATSARPNEVRALFRNCRVIGKRFRLAHIMFGGTKIIEVATFRKDPSQTEAPDWFDPSDETEEGARRPEDHEDLLIRHDNVFGEPPEDAVRRDFTMNALFYDLQRRELVDYVGGLDDIARKVIRTIGDADVRFREDPVRILRVIKFAARLDLGIEPEVYDAMLAHRDDLMRAARPRLLEELLRLLRHGASRRSFWIAWESGVLAVLLPELAAFLDDDPDGNTRLWRRLEALDESVKHDGVPSDAVLISTLLLEPVEEVLHGSRDTVALLTDYLADVQERLAIPRRLFDRMRQILAVQRRLRTGRHVPLARRDFYPESAEVYALDAIARGVNEQEISRVVQGREVQPKAQVRA